MKVARESAWWMEVFSKEERAVYDRYRRASQFEFPWTECALVVVDVTHAFLGPDLPTELASREIRTACGEPGWRAVAELSPLLEAFRSAGSPIVFAKPDWANEGFFGGTTRGGSRAVEHDAIPEEVAPREGELVVVKPKASAFFATSLLSYLVRHGLRGIVIAGCTTSGCVRATAVDAASSGLEVAVAVEACFDRSGLSHAVALAELDAKYARCLSCASVIRHVVSRVSGE
jgi:maleamate amidohydrolase